MEKLKKDGTPAKKPGRKPVVYEEKMKSDAAEGNMTVVAVKVRPLPVEALKSRVIAAGIYRRGDDGMILDRGHAELHLTAEEWKRFSEEIGQALRQLGLEE